MDYNQTNGISDYRSARSHVHNMVERDIDNTNIDFQNVKNESLDDYDLDFLSLNSRKRITFKEDKENLLENQNANKSKLIDATNIDLQNVKNEPLDGYDLDFVNINSRKRIIFKEDKENLLENENANKSKLISENFKVTSQNVLSNDIISEQLEIKQEPLKQDNFKSNLISLSSKNRITYKEDTEELYKDHVIKEELVLGPEIIQGVTEKRPLREKLIFADDAILASDKNKKKTFECDSCCKLFVFKKGLKKHKRICVTMFTCDYCKKTFNTRARIIYHIKSHMKQILKQDKAIISNATYDQICEICEKRFVFKDSLMRHMQSHISQGNIANSANKCNICGKLFSHQNNLNRHLKIIHAGIKPYKCNECGKTYTQKSDFLNHCQKIHNIPSECTQRKRPITCHFCNMLFTDLRNCYRHMKYYCTLNKNKIKRMIKNSKIRVKGNFPCNICEKTYITQDSLRRHRKKHLNTRVTHQCDFCRKGFTNKHYLRYHIHTKHMKIESVTVHPCDKCGKTFVSPWNLSLHKKSHNIGSNSTHDSLYCNTCSRTFRKPENLERHKKVHLEISKTKYQCDLCDKVYEVKNKITSHIQLAHGFKKIVCPKCKQNFRHYSGLAKHKKICCATAASQHVIEK